MKAQYLRLPPKLHHFPSKLSIEKCPLDFTLCIENSTMSKSFNVLPGARYQVPGVTRRRNREKETGDQRIGSSHQGNLGSEDRRRLSENLRQG